MTNLPIATEYPPVTYFLWIISAPLVFLTAKLIYDWLYPDQASQGDPTAEFNPMSDLLTDLTFAAHTPVKTADNSDQEQKRLDSEQDQFALPRRIAKMMSAYRGRWGIAGGWSLSLACGRRIREHEDIEIALLRKDQALLAEHIAGWHVEYVDSQTQHELRPWHAGLVLDPPVHELQARPPQADVKALELLLNESSGNTWIYRRDKRVTLELDKAFIISGAGVPVLAAEIVLLFKSKSGREKDESDFRKVLPLLRSEQLKWLALALEVASPGHRWIQVLQKHY